MEEFKRTYIRTLTDEHVTIVLRKSLCYEIVETSTSSLPCSIFGRILTGPRKMTLPVYFQHLFKLYKVHQNSTYVGGLI